ncbi:MULTISPECIES: 3-isopropylmalate dehydrogenase [Pseudonocardia]|uniref:3-isopropylmalate dehydrogenase n=2 Tax=Pseudonocardia TaxID=1847 RepID=A0A1Y2MRI3_PSEAH|nr:MULTISPECIES: 3-isopropylmalate dehydrogenase [Pseudonocardia]OSY37751.1 3-isopropylmalate dehydrogenase [Pseudonocardia autotrophica]TDN75759.1 3-isopropylmalate dehydrogenase [Pseudonocardia autotrophica]BBF99729.1 3-isopropylmalate dehydrogenase [Pseudonocardia autotrophica]GEC27180.1 3-isopropylmalate dehydrogenase [Pseudonocardia saturnea]
MREYDLAVVGGDGIGPDVTDAALAGVLAAAGRFGFAIRTTRHDLGAERYLRTGTVLDDDAVAALRGHDAILLGAVGDPRVPPGVLEQGLVIALRVALRQSVNLRPVRLYPGVTSPVTGVTPDNCDLVIVRENTEGLYSGGGSTSHAGTPHAIALQHSVTTTAATHDAVQFAFRLAAARRGRLTLCHKTNVLVHAGRLWSDVVEQVAADFPDVEHDYVHADAMCQHLPLDPGRFDVVVTDNLFGDIISDLGATVQGGLGLAASANHNPHGDGPSMFEPVHGSAPDIAGTGGANPAAAALSAAMCLAGLGEAEAALALEAATASVLAELPALAGPAMGADTATIGARIAERVGSAAPIGDPATSFVAAFAGLAPRRTAPA